MRVAIRLAAAAALALAACGEDHPVFSPIPLADPVRVSGASPFPPGCNAAPQRGVRYPGSEVEPSLAANPVDPAHLVAAWQQDRWSDGGSDGLVTAVSHDGGASWTAALVPFSLCGGGAGHGGDYQRATDPWVAFSADGAVVHLVGLAFDATTARTAVVASRSTDGGVGWSDPVALAADASPDFGLDKPSVTADPVDPLRAYAAWDRLTGLTASDPSVSTGPAWFSRSSDGGRTWSAPIVLYDPGADAQTISSQLVVLPGGALVNVFVRITAASTKTPLFEVVAARSADQGTTWGAPVVVAALLARGASDPKTGHAIRAGEVVPSTAVDPATGAVHVVWEDARFSGGARDGIALSTSTDGGLTWSAPVQVNGAPAVEAFRPAVAVGGGGTVAVTYYDFRNDVAADRSHTWTTFWLATSADGGATWRDVPEGGPFDLRTAPDADGWFLGDYTGLVASRAGFVALFGMGGDSTDVFASR
jgi:BNR repeat protein